MRAVVSPPDAMLRKVFSPFRSVIVSSGETTTHRVGATLRVHISREHVFHG